jgi:nitrile hydratase accessory protein
MSGSIPGLPQDAAGPVFNAPWEAQAFAMAVSLEAKGVFTWGEWAEKLGEQIKIAQADGDLDEGGTYYHHWLATLERLATEKGVTDPASLARYQHAWEHAAARVPHGQPIELMPGDFHDP